MIYITGHQKPDSDSIVSAIAYSYLKKQLGYDTLACRLGPLSKESEYLLNRFDFPLPYLLEDARSTLSEIDILPPSYIDETATLFEALQAMKSLEQPFIAVCDPSKNITGMITRNDIANLGVEDTADGIELLKNVDLFDIQKTLNGKLIYACPMHLNGKVSIVALSRHEAARYAVQNRIVIVSDDPLAQKELIKKGAGLLVLVWCDTVEEDVLNLAKQYQCPILLSGHGSMNTSRYLYFSIKVSALMSKELIHFDKEEYVEDVIKRVSRYRYRSYPILFENQLYGYLQTEKILHYQNRSIILVDHNEFSQSVKNIEKAHILEVIDHHRINDFTSKSPIYFRNETVGSTCTIVASMFFEHSIPIPRKLAGLLLSGIISDTLNFQSPTTTKKDLELAHTLSLLAHENIENLAYDIFFSNDVSSKNINDLMQEDLKHFQVGPYQVVIAQSIVPEFSLLPVDLEQLQSQMNQYVQRNGCDLYLLALTSILENGSNLYASGPLASLISLETFQPNMLSRKKQILPLISAKIAELL